MAVKEFELFHGVVLTRILRSEKPVALRLVETRPHESWSTYTLNDTVNLFITHSTGARAVSRGGRGKSWTFVLSKGQVKQLDAARTGRETWVALVCATKQYTPILVCLLSPDEVAKVIKSSDSRQQSLTVRRPDGGRFRVFEDKRELFKVAASRISGWEIPGS